MARVRPYFVIAPPIATGKSNKIIMSYSDFFVNKKIKADNKSALKRWYYSNSVLSIFSLVVSGTKYIIYVSLSHISQINFSSLVSSIIFG